MERWMLDYGFKAVGPDWVMFRLDLGTEKLIRVSLYVDDCVCATNSQKLYDEFVADLSKKYTLSSKGKLKWYLGVTINHDVEKVCTPAITPSDPNLRLLRSHLPAVPNAEDTKYYQQMIGRLMYASMLTRPDIAFSVNQCARFMSNLGPEHILAAKRIL
eukprot:2413477-Rhodomonas_salina.1